MKPKQLIETLRAVANEGSIMDEVLQLQSAQGHQYCGMTKINRRDLLDLVEYFDSLHENQPTTVP